MEPVEAANHPVQERYLRTNWGLHGENHRLVPYWAQRIVEIAEIPGHFQLTLHRHDRPVQPLNGTEEILGWGQLHGRSSRCLGPEI